MAYADRARASDCCLALSRSPLKSEPDLEKQSESKGVKMSRKSLAALLFVVSLAGSIAPLFASQTVVPSSLDDLVRFCTTVAVVDVADARIVERTGAAGPIKFVEVRATVVRSIKGSLLPGRRITFLDPLSEFSPDDPLEIFAAKSRCIILLNWNSTLGEAILVSHEATFRVKDDRIRPVGRSALARSQAGRSSDSFERDLRTAEARERRVR
jgi:hypothetical protein